MEYLSRVVDAELDELLDGLAAVALEGPKDVGKTETTKRRAATMIALDNPAQLAIARADVAQLLKGKKPILVDEWQHYPPAWDAIRRSIDLDGRPNQFFFTDRVSQSGKPAFALGCRKDCKPAYASTDAIGARRRSAGLAPFAQPSEPACGHGGEAKGLRRNK